MDKREKLARTRLIQTRHIGPMTFSLLIQRYESALAAIPDLAERGRRKLSIASLADAKVELAANDDAGAKLNWRDSDSYPLRLAQFDDAPVTLSTRLASSAPLKFPLKKRYRLKCYKQLLPTQTFQDVDDLIAWCDQPSVVVWHAARSSFQGLAANRLRPFLNWNWRVS